MVCSIYPTYLVCSPYCQGVFIEGRAVPGTVIAIYPGAVYYSKFLTTEVLQDNEYMISRYDNTVIDGRDWCRRALEMHQVGSQHPSNNTESFLKKIKRFRNP